ncbi:MAG: PAS domain-containing protein [Proteobacteria bacterium]|nr:PAS domain-containing protein [Pseudomonadota bacterium]MBU1419866.1 PAS domain-containing protein [Pseudomonadota bacterium]MBU1456843.1 PAS domain-containing protein [Pseudomonadota bacterium]
MAGKATFNLIWQMGYRAKALFIVSAIIFFISLSFFYYGVNQHNQTIDLVINKTEEDISNSISHIRNRSFLYYEKRLLAFTQLNTGIIKAFAERDRERLYELTLPRFNVLKKENSSFSNLHFYLPDGRSFLHMHDLECQDDEQGIIRSSLQRVQEEKRVFSEFLVCAYGGVIRILGPVYYQGNCVGVVGFYLNMHLAVDVVQEHLRLQATTYFIKEEWEKAYAFDKFPMVERDHLVLNSHGDPIYDKIPRDMVMSEELHRPVEIEGKYYIVHIHPAFNDLGGRLIGGMIILQDVTQLIENKRIFLHKTILFTICLLVLGFAALHLSFNKLLVAMSREMIKRTEAENLYKEAKIFLECMIDSVQDLIFYKDRSGTYLGCNKAFADLTGYEKESIVGHTDSELFQPGLAEFFSVHDQETIHNGRPYTYENWLELENSLLYMHTHKMPYQGPDKSLIGVIGISRNLTIYKQATETLELAMDTEVDAIYILNLDRRLVQANKAFYKMVGADAETVLGRHIVDIVHPQGEAVPCQVCQAQEKLQDTRIVLEANHPENSTGVPLEITVTIVRDSDQKPLSIFMRRHDLSEQRAVEDRLRRSREKWERTFDAISDLITIQDFDMHIIRANKAAEDFFQVERGGLVGRYCHEVFRGQNRPCEGCPMLSVAGQIGEYPPIIRHENLQKVFHISSSPLLAADGKVEYLVHIARDITAQKQLEEELYQVHKMEAIGTLAGGIAHDFNNILTAIIGFSEFVREDLAVDSPSRNDMDQVLQAAARAKDLVGQILSFSRKRVHLLQPVEPYSIAREVAKMLHSTLPSTVTIEEELDENAGMIEADPIKIHQILINLCTNAFQAMEGEKGVLRITLRRLDAAERTTFGGEDLPGSYIVLQVSDTGQGMSKETRERIFDPFFSTKEVGEGTGLGLAVLHGIVQDFKGVVEVESTLGAGSVFRVYLPAIDNIEESQPVECNYSGREGCCGSEEILVVDDDPMLVQFFGRFLRHLGYRVTEMTSSQEALKAVRREPRRFDLLITDQTMPELTGAELAVAVMQIDPKIPVIMCTGYSSVMSERDALAMGIRRYVFKPVRGPELVNAVQEVLNEQGSEFLMARIYDEENSLQMSGDER